MASTYYENLIKTVIDASKGLTWEEAVNEWEIVDCIEDEDSSSVCICGKDRLRYLYTIRNSITGISLFPIGSTCIKKFERDDLMEEVAVKEKMFKLLHAVNSKKIVELSSEYFSKKLLFAFYKADVFKPTQYNNFNGYADYKFMLDMFNRRDKSSISQAQRRKINGIIAFSIKPYLVKTLKIKNRQKKNF